MPSLDTLQPYIHKERANTFEDLKASAQLFSSCWTRDNRQQGSNSWSTQP